MSSVLRLGLLKEIDPAFKFIPFKESPPAFLIYSLILLMKIHHDRLALKELTCVFLGFSQYLDALNAH